MRSSFILFLLLSSLHADEKQDAAKVPVKVEQTQHRTATIKPHTAEYQISLIKNNNPDVSDAVGSLVIVVKESNGLTIEQHAILKVRFTDGSEDEYETFLASWESKDGKQYHFSLKTNQNKEDEVTIRGKAKLNETSGTVEYQIPEGQKVELSSNTLFPMQFLRTLLEQAMNKHTTFSSTVFDGSNETFIPINVESAMQPTSPKLNIKGNCEIDFNEAYLLQMAVYDPKDKGMDPVYVTSQMVQKNGIIISLEMDFQEIGFTTRAQLVKVDL